MTEIKFRVWDIEERKIREIQELSFNKDNSVCCAKIRGFTSTGGMFLYPQITGHFMQFTGSRDKNGKEVYEGDIVAFEAKKCESCQQEKSRTRTQLVEARFARRRVG